MAFPNLLQALLEASRGFRYISDRLQNPAAAFAYSFLVIDNQDPAFDIHGFLQSTRLDHLC